MRKISFLWLSIAVTLMLTNIGMAQDRNRAPDERQREAERREQADALFAEVQKRKPAIERPRGNNPRRDNQKREQNSDDARARAEKAMRNALKVMRDADKLTDKQAEEIFNIVFPKEIDWDARYEAFLKENPGVAKAVKSGKISKEKVIAGIKSREGERPPTEEEQLEALYQKLRNDDPTLGRTPKAALMPRLKAMLARGEGKNLRPENSTRQRVMSFGLYLNGLIESGQVERFDKDLKKVHDLGVGEIGRQGRQAERGRAEDPARGGRLREDSARGNDSAARGSERPLSPAVARLHREVGNYDFTARINMDAVGQDGGVINFQGTADLQMILDGQFLLNRGLQGGNESVTIIGVTGGDDDEYFRFSLDGGQTGFMYVEGGFQDDGSRVLTHPGGGRGPDYAFRTTFEEGGGFTTSFLVGPQQAEFLNVTHTRARRRPTDVLETMLSSPVKPTSVNRSANSPDPGANFSPEHLVLQEFAGDFEAEGGAGEVRSRMICQGRFLISELSVDGDDVVVLTGFDSAKKRFGQIVLDPKTPGYRLLEGTQQADGTIVLAASDGRGGLAWTLTRHEDGGYTFDDGGRSMRFRPNVGERARGAVGERPGEPGTLKWSVPLGGGVGYHSPAVAEDGTIYMAADGQRLVALNPDGTVKWTFVASSGSPTAGAAIGKDGTIYIGTWSQDGRDSRIYAITKDGTEKWSYPVGDKIDFSSPAIGKDGTIYFGSDDDHIYALNPDGSEKWRFEMNGVDDMDSSPAIGEDSTIYVASRDGNLYAIHGESGGLAETPWPIFGCDSRHTGRAQPDVYSPPLMKPIPKGEYEMGNHSNNPIHDKLNVDAIPVHTVSIDDFWMDIYEVTKQKYCEYLNSAYGQGLVEVSDGVVHKAGDTEPYCDTYSSSPYSRIHWDGKVFTVAQEKEDHPMVEVSWYGAAAFANWRSAEERLAPCYDLETWECDFDSGGFRLPTEAEWEKAARGGQHNPYYDWPWGNDIDGSKANYLNSGDPFDRDMPATTPVGYYNGGQTPPGEDMANGYGLYDMSGNVAEWCNDWYDKRYYNVSPKDNPHGPESGTTRVCRNGSWGYKWSLAMRIGLYHPDYRGSNNGFRLALGK